MTLYFAISFNFIFIISVLALGALVFRYFRCYLHYVKTPDLQKDPFDKCFTSETDLTLKDFVNFKSIFTCNSPWTILHILFIWLVYSVSMFVWPVTILPMTIVLLAKHHRKSFQRKIDFENTLSGKHDFL